MNAPIDVTGIRIETERLILRPWRESDVADMYEYSKVPGVGEMAGWCHHESIAESHKVINMFIGEKDVLAIEDKESGKVIGSLGIHENDNDHVGSDYLGREVGYVLSKDFWGRGLMPEAVSGVIAYCFDVLGFDYLTCGHFTGNSQSQRVIEKCGFTFFGESEFETRLGTIEIARNYVLYNPNK